MPLVSVLIPALDAGHTVRAAVESMLDCDLAHAGEVQVVVAPDDGSMQYDACMRGLRGVVVLEPTHRVGPGPSRNRARQAAAGAWLTLLDADDLVSSGYLDDLVDLAQRTGAACVFSRTAYEDDGRLVRVLPRSPYIDRERMSSFVGSIRAFFRREIWLDFPAMMAEDVWVESSLLHAVGGRAPLSDRALYRAQLRSASLCVTTPQAELNACYRQAIDQAPNPLTAAVFTAKLEMGQRFAQHMAGGGTLGFHDFVAGGALA
jgi:glycosyltransferase involved in cell wall biosynthesis